MTSEQYRAIKKRAMTQPAIDFEDAQNLIADAERLRAWIVAIGGLADVNADERSTMARLALAGEPAPSI